MHETDASYDHKYIFDRINVSQPLRLHRDSFKVFLISTFAPHLGKNLCLVRLMCSGKPFYRSRS